MEQYTANQLAERTIAPPRRRGRHLGHAGGQRRAHVPGDDAAPGRDFNQVVYWSRPLTWKNQTLTPNPDTIYLMPFFNTKDVGPMVLEIPPADDEARSPAASTMPGRRRWRMSDRPAWTRARAAST